MSTADLAQSNSLADENAKLRALVHRMGSNMPDSPPATEKSLSEPSSPYLRACASTDSLPFTSIAEADELSPLNLGLSSIALNGDSAMQAVVALFKQQMAAQAAAQDQLLSQLGELRASHANLQAATSDVNDELTILRNTADQLADQVEQERKRRESAEAEKEAEAEKVTNLRQKMEESRRAIMRLQEEAASKRNNDSRRGSLPTINQATVSDNRRASMQLGRRSSLAIPDTRRASLGGYALGIDAARRNSCEVGRRGSDSGVGLGLEGVMMDASNLAGNRRASVAAIGTRSRLSSTVDEEARSGLKNMILASDKTAVSPDENDFVPPSRNQPSRASLTSIAIDEDGQAPTFESPVRRSSIRSSYRTSIDLGGFKTPLARTPTRTSMPDIHVAPDAEASEVVLLKAQLSAMQNKLALAQEAKEASDTCLSALKEFIALPKVSPSLSSAMKLPPMPTDDIPDEEVAPVSRRASMWRLPGFAVTAAPEPVKVSPPRAQSLAVSSTSKTDESSSLTAFSGWSVRRRASAVSPKEKRASLSSSITDPMPSTFDGFSFQSRARNPALDDSPASPGRGPPSISSSESSSPPWGLKMQC